jgi:hypothetical protein
MPFRVVENPEFRKLIHILRSGLYIPRRTAIRNSLSNHYNDIRSQLLLDLPSGLKVSIALDGWQSPFKKSFLTVTAYYVTGDWEYQEVRE